MVVEIYDVSMRDLLRVVIADACVHITESIFADFNLYIQGVSKAV